MSYSRYKVFKLEGRSLKAAKALDLAVRKAYAKNPVPYKNKKFAEINRLALEFNATTLEMLQQHHKDLLDVTGLSHSVIQIIVYKDDTPSRAFRIYPELYASPDSPPDYYMYAPVDYNGKNFEPEDGRALSNEEREKVAARLFGGGAAGLETQPVFSRALEKVPVPTDFDRHKSDSVKALQPRSPRPPDGPSR